MKKTLIVFICMSLAWCIPANAVVLKGTDIADMLTVGEKSLVLNGVGLRKKFGFKAYYAGLYLPKKNSDAPAILEADEPQALVMYWRRGADTKKIQLVFLKSLAKSAGVPFQKIYTMDTDYGIYTREITTLVSWVSEVPANKPHIWSFHYIPGKGLDVYVDNSVTKLFKGTIPDIDFKRILWGIWIGDKTAVSKKMSNDMLGNSE